MCFKFNIFILLFLFYYFQIKDVAKCFLFSIIIGLLRVFNVIAAVAAIFYDVVVSILAIHNIVVAVFIFIIMLLL